MLIRILMPFAVVAVLAGVTGAARGESIHREYSEQFPAPPGTRLSLQHGDGDVSVSAWEKPEVDVHIVYRGEVKQVGFGNTPDFHAEFRQNGNTISVVGRESSGVNFGMRFVNIQEYTYTVRAPAEVALELRGEDGDVEIRDWRGDIDCRLDDGDVRLSGVQASVSLQLEDGDVEIAGFRGRLAVHADDGDVRVEESRLDDARFRLEDGDLGLRECTGKLEAELDDGNVVMDGVHLGRGRIRSEDGDVKLSLREPGVIDLDVASADGDVEITLEEGANAALSLHSEDGTIDLDLGGVSDLKRERGGVSGRLGDGQGRIRIRTEGGDISLRDVPGGGGR